MSSGNKYVWVSRRVLGQRFQSGIAVVVKRPSTQNIPDWVRHDGRVCPPGGLAGRLNEVKLCFCSIISLSLSHSLGQISQTTISYFVKTESVSVSLWVEVPGKHTSCNCLHPTARYQPCQVKAFVIGHVQAEFGLPSVRDVGERILSPKSKVGIKELNHKNPITFNTLLGCWGFFSLNQIYVYTHMPVCV